jgi:chaperonin GroEL (HSP60 family)
VRRALSYPLKLIAKNAGVNGSVVTEKVQLDYQKSHAYTTVQGMDLNLI